MLKSLRSIAFLAFILSLCFAAIPASAQLGNSGSIEGLVKDESGGWLLGQKWRLQIQSAASDAR